MSLTRQGRHYLTIGALQWLVDWGVMVLLSHAGMLVAPANVAGRISGAMLGYWLNGRITFAGADSALGRVQFARFAMMWLAMTALSTLLIDRIDNHLGLQWAWLAKPAVEAALGLLGFMISRHWVYKA
ncbi:MAG: GtrA family protein [Gammaproteobacteria bacterium]